jgi:hypothetical protein
MQTREFVARLYERHGHGLVEKLTAIRYHNVTSRARRGLAGGSTGNPDCGFLYLLVKAFARRSIFEIGTYVGTSAVAMTMAGGHVTTCDPNDYDCLPPGIRFLNMTDMMHCACSGARVPPLTWYSPTPLYRSTPSHSSTRSGVKI